MPLRLILIRHAKSSWDDLSLPDHDRPLNKRGRASARAVGNWLRDKGFLPDTGLVSSACRTCETWELLGVEAPFQTKSALYHASADTMLGQLQRASGDTVLILGHNPGIGDFSERLAAALPAHSGFLHYPTCATTVFEFDKSAWRDVGFGMGQVLAFVTPRELLE